MNIKLFPFPLPLKVLAATAALLSSARSATILDPKVYVGIADGGIVAVVNADNYQNYQHIGYWSSLSGGQMIISVSPGQSVSSATMSVAWASSPQGLETAAYTKFWTLGFGGSFPTVGVDTGDQLWKEPSPFGAWWQSPDSSGQLVYVKIKFEAITSEGIVVDDNGGAGYRGFVPEPSSTLLFGAALPLLSRRRRKTSLSC